MDLGLNGKKAIVTGATRGIGRAIAETLANEGAEIAICARHQDQVSQTVNALTRRGNKAIGAVVDVTQVPELRKWIADAAQALGGIDILIPNASALATANNENAWESGYRTDIMGTVHAVEAARPFLERAALTRGDASIVIIASVSGVEAHYASAYGAWKAALIHFAKGIARQDASRRIRANVVSPGMVNFPGSIWNEVEQKSPDRFRHFLHLNPTGRMATPLEIANAVVFLASPASSFTTGINMIIDGALTARTDF